MKDQNMWNKERERLQKEAERIENLWISLNRQAQQKHSIIEDPEFGLIQESPNSDSWAKAANL